VYKLPAFECLLAGASPAELQAAMVQQSMMTGTQQVLHAALYPGCTVLLY